MLIINEIITGDDIIEIKFEQVVKFPLKNILPMDRCSFCSKIAQLEEDERLPRCTKCYRSAYCNSECQTKDWNKHNNTLCCKPLDQVGVPVLITINKNQIDSLDKILRILTEVSMYSVEINSECFEKKMEFGLLNEANGKIEKIETLDEILKLHPTKLKKIQLKWNNNGEKFRIKTCLNKFNFADESIAQSTSVNINECLKLFTQSERLTRDNPWFCSKCKKHQEATKQMNIWRLPKYLIITLKRFQATKASDNFYNEELVNKYMMMNSNLSSFLQNRVVYNKLNTDVQFPIR